MPPQPTAHMSLDSFIAYLIPCEVPRAKSSSAKRSSSASASAPQAEEKAAAVPKQGEKKDGPAIASAMHKARWEFAAQYIKAMFFFDLFGDLNVVIPICFFRNVVFDKHVRYESSSKRMRVPTWQRPVLRG